MGGDSPLGLKKPSFNLTGRNYNNEKHINKHNPQNYYDKLPYFKWFHHGKRPVGHAPG